MMGANNDASGSNLASAEGKISVVEEAPAAAKDAMEKQQVEVDDGKEPSDDCSVVSPDNHEHSEEAKEADLSDDPPKTFPQKVSRSNGIPRRALARLDRQYC